MPKLLHSLLIATLLALAVGAPGETAAARKRGSAEMTAEEAAAQVQRRTGGQAIGVQEDNVNGRKVYRVRILTREGRVREISVDARSRDN